jgi:hypothetical protein
MSGGKIVTQNAIEKRKAAPRGVWHGLIFVSVKRDIGCPWWGRTDVEK